ncbi:MAG TPA: penicillin-binding protein 2 [Clostridiaceae bacterium]|nr:penicillin-binding protein 2 [Clostridiaceae bacterium]
MDKLNKIKVRYNIILLGIYIIGIILLVQLFNLQIVKGEEYRKQSNTRLTRETTIKAARGNICDRTGNKLVSTKMEFNLELYKTKIDNKTLNETILDMINILDKNEDTYIDNLPIKVEPFEFVGSDETIQSWKKTNKIQENLSAEECFYKLKQKYEIIQENVQDARKIMGVRYEISSKGYSSTKTVELAKNISRTSMLEISEQNSNFPGINIVTVPTVTYNFETLASHILGTVGKITQPELEGKTNYDINDIIGKTGIQYVFEEYLKGKDGIKQIDMAVDGTVTDEYTEKEAVSGSDVILTIDANLQKVAEEALKDDIKKIASGGFAEKSNANAGAVVVMNVKSGEVLALASYPDYEPQLFVEGISTEKYNEYVNSTEKPLFNRAISGAYAPGSTFKMVTAIAGLETNKITPTEKINDIGVYPRGHHPVCWYYTSFHSGHGYLNVSEAIKHSCNYFFYELGYRMGIDTLSKYASYFGLGRKTGIELQGEAVGDLATREKVEKQNKEWYLADTLSAAIGQSYNNFTPVQMAKYISMLVNGGNPIDVSIVKNIINIDGQEVSKQEINEFVNKKLNLQDEKVENLNMKKENIKAVLEGMRGVTSESGGTAYSTFKNFEIEVGGKTGSAQTGNGTNGWFVGFAPFDDPEIAVVVLVENGGHGGYTAEVAKKIIAEYFGMNAKKVDENMSASSNIQTVR